MCNWFLIVWPAYLKRKMNIKFLLASLKQLANFNSKIVLKAVLNLGSRFPSLLLVVFFSVQYDRILEQFSGSQAAFGTTFRVAGGYRKAGTSFLKRVIGRIFAIST